MKFTWFGQSAFALDADGITVLIDPFLSGNPVNTIDASTIRADVILLTHAHNDHVGDTVDIAKRSDATVIATFELANYINSQGVAKTIGGNFGGTVSFAGGSAKFVPAWHTSSYATANGIVAQGIPAGYVVRFGGKTTYFAGDTCVFLDMQLIGEEELDIAVLPIGDLFTMGPKDALKAAKMLRAGMIIPCHYNTFPAIAQDAGKFKQDVEAATASIVTVLQPGQTVEL